MDALDERHDEHASPVGQGTAGRRLTGYVLAIALLGAPFAILLTAPSARVYICWTNRARGISGGGAIGPANLDCSSPDPGFIPSTGIQVINAPLSATVTRRTDP